MGTLLEKSKLAEDLLLTIGTLFGRFRGGLALAVVFVGALLATATGSGGRICCCDGDDIDAGHVAIWLL